MPDCASIRKASSERSERIGWNRLFGMSIDSQTSASRPVHLSLLKRPAKVALASPNPSSASLPCCASSRKLPATGTALMAKSSGSPCPPSSSLDIETCLQAGISASESAPVGPLRRNCNLRQVPECRLKVQSSACLYLRRAQEDIRAPL